MSQNFDVRPSVLYENRYCDQNEFDIIINHECNEGEESTNRNIQVENDNVNCNVVLIPVSAYYYYAKTAVIGSDIFVLLGKDDIKVRKLIKGRKGGDFEILGSHEFFFFLAYYFTTFSLLLNI